MTTASIPRRVYDLFYWGLVIAAGFLLRDQFLINVKPQFDAWLGMFAVPGMLVAAVAVFVVLVYVNEAIASTVTSLHGSVTTGGPVRFDGTQSPASLMRTARKMERRGQIVDAGEIYESLNAWGEAASAFARAGQFSRAAAAYEMGGDRAHAIGLYESDQNFEKAAQCATADGQRDRAAANYIKAAEKAAAENSFAKAADYFEKAGSFGRAGRVYETVRRIEDALRCYERAGDIVRIEEILRQLDPNEIAMKGNISQEIIRRSAELLVRQGQHRKAAESLESLHDYVRAAEIYELAADWERAGEAYLQAELTDKAQRCYAQVTDPVKVADFNARLAKYSGDWKTAGDHFVAANKLPQAVEAYKRARDYASAARIYEQLKRYIMAGEMYSAAKDFRAAGEAYAKSHDWRNAADCFEKSGDMGQAMVAYASAGNYFRAGVLSLGAGDTAKAMEYLQRVPPTMAEYAVATGHMAAIYASQGQRELAHELFTKVIDQIVPSPETLPILYAYGRLLEDQQMPGAVAIFRRILGVDMNYQDAASRAARIERQEAAAAATRPVTEVPGLTQQAALADGSASGTITATGFVSMRTAESQLPTQTVARRDQNITQEPETRFGNQGRYVIMHEIGRGGMAIVYKAFDQHLEREMALKTFPLSSHGGIGHEEVFLREARLIARLSHPNIVTIFDCGRMDFLYYIAMEYVAGENLKQLIKRKGPMAVDEFKSIFRQLNDALIYAHSQQVLHRDIKPGNIIVRSTGEIKVVDFGLAKILTDAASHVAANEDSQRTLVGTPQYMAPEQILGTPVDARTDIYALGLTMFYVLTGRTPFDVKKITDPLEISRMQINSSFPRPSTLRATLPSQIDELFVRCTQKNPADRYPTVNDFAEDLLRI